MLDRKAILAKKDIKIEPVKVPEWGGSVFVKSLNGEERDDFENSMWEGRGEDRKENMNNLRARFIVLVVCDEEGNRIFSDADAPAVGKKNAAILNKIFTVGQRLSGMTKEDVDALTKNSESGPSDVSTSESQNGSGSLIQDIGSDNAQEEK